MSPTRARPDGGGGAEALNTDDPAGTLLKLDYLGVRARIVVNRHGDHWRATFQRRWREGKGYGDAEPLQTLTYGEIPAFPDRFVALMAAVGTVVEEEDERLFGDGTDDDPAR